MRLNPWLGFVQVGSPEYLRNANVLIYSYFNESFQQKKAPFKIKARH